MKIFKIKTWFIILFSLILLLVIALFLAPGIGKNYIVKHSVELLGRKLDIEKIRVNYFTGTVRVDNLVMYEKDAKGVFLSFKQFKIRIDYLPLLKKEFRVTAVSIDNPYVQVIQNGEHFNFDDLVAGDTTKVKKDTVKSEPVKYLLNNITISRGHVKYTDQQLKNTIAFNKLDLKIPGVTWNSNTTKMEFTLKFIDGGSLYSRLTVNQADSTYAMNLKLNRMNLDIILPYVQEYLNVSAMHGYLTNDVIVKGSMNHVMQIFIHGMNHVKDFQMVDNNKRTILSFMDSSFDFDTLLVDKERLILNTVNLVNPYMLVEIIDSTNNWMKLMKPSEPEPTSPATATAPSTSTSESYAFAFTKFFMSGGRIKYIDNTVHYPFEYTLDKVLLETARIPNSGGKYSLHATASLNNTGSLLTDAVYNPDNFDEMDLKMALERFRMKDVDAYFKHYFGFPIKGGIMNFATDNKMRVNYLKSDNAIYFRKFALDKRLKDKTAVYNYPLRLGISVLSDKDGIIDLKAPVEVKGEKMKVKNLGKIIFKVIGNLFIKAAVAPFNMLGSMFNANPEQIKEINLDLVNPMPDKGNMESLDVLVNILNKKPGLNIDFYYYRNPVKSADSLAHMLALKDYFSQGGDMTNNTNTVADSTLISYLLKKPSMANTPANTGLTALCRAFIGEDKLRIKLDSIKAGQEEFLRTYLVNEKAITADRFKISDPPSDTIRSVSGNPAFITSFGDETDNQK